MAKRILIILRRLGMGGIQTQTALLAGEFLRRGCSVTVLVQKKPHKGDMEVRMPEGAEVLCRDFDRESKLNPVTGLLRLILTPLSLLFIGKVGDTFIPGIFISRLTGKLIERLEEKGGKFDLILIRGETAVEELFRVRHRNLWQVIEGGLPDFSRNRFARRFAESVFGGRNIVCVSDGERESLLRSLGSAGAKPARIITIPNFIDADLVRRKSLEDLPGLPEPGYLVTVGRLSPLKNQALAIRTLRLLPRSVRLVLVGDGKCRGELERLAVSEGVSDRCLFAGNQPNPFPWIRRAAMLVHTSRHEAFGMVIAEALALGKPLAVTRSTGGLCGILIGPLASSVVDPDEKSLAGRITEVLESGVKPDTSVLQEFSAGSTAGKFLSLTDE